MSTVSPSEDFRLHQVPPNHKRVDVRELGHEKRKQEGRDSGLGCSLVVCTEDARPGAQASALR